MTPPPLRTFASTAAASRPALSRFGPTAPFVPALESVWHEPQFEVNTCLPSAAPAPPPPPTLYAAAPTAPPLWGARITGPASSIRTKAPARIHVPSASHLSKRRSIRAQKRGGNPLF